MRKQRGFSLIELLIVVTIILIIAAMATSSFLRARMAANESAAASSIRTLNTAQVSYSTTYAAVGYAKDLTSLGPNGVDCTDPTKVDKDHACLIDNVLGCTGGALCIKGRYNYNLKPITAAGSDYQAEAWPLGTVAGSKRYCSLPDAVVRFDGTNIATEPDTAACKAMTAIDN